MAALYNNIDKNMHMVLFFNKILIVWKKNQIYQMNHIMNKILNKQFHYHATKVTN